MAEKSRCEICGMEFKNEEGLAQHKAAKHPVIEKKQSINSRKIRNWTVFIIIIGLVIFFIGWLISSTINGINYCKIAPVTEIDIGGHTNLALHNHADLEMIIDGKAQIIPANIGILPGVMRPIHTHDAGGELHMEGPCKRDFKLGDFFAIWGKKFNSQCIFDKCTDSGALKMTVNGFDNKEFENYILKDDDDIVIEYNSKA